MREYLSFVPALPEVEVGQSHVEVICPGITETLAWTESPQARGSITVDCAGLTPQDAQIVNGQVSGSQQQGKP